MKVAASKRDDDGALFMWGLLVLHGEVWLTGDDDTL